MRARFRRRILAERLEERALLAAVIWDDPGEISFGTLLSADQLNATADVPGTFSYDPPVGARLNPGTDQSLTVSFTPDDALLDQIDETVLIDVLASSQFRTIDGSFNHLDDVQLAVAGQQQLRQASAAYEDGISVPRGGDPSSLSNPRSISNAVLAQGDRDIASKRHLSRMVFQFGQFLDHDIVLTPEGGDEFSIPVPAGDESFDPFNTGTVEIPLRRSVSDPTTGTSVENPRQQINTLTSFIDGSVIYGSDDERSLALRSGVGGKLIVSDGQLLPFNEIDTPLLPNANATGLDESDLFVAGDIRANEQIGLTAMHTLFVREHNRWAERIAGESFAGEELSDPQIDEDIYQQARRIVGTELQVIAYNEFLPAVMGQDALTEYQGFDETVDPRISNEFATAAFRVGHTMLPDELTLIDGDGDLVESRPLASAFFRPDVVSTSGIDSILRGMALKPQQAIDRFMIDGVRNFLFGPPAAGGLDLASLNIQRGRDHGVPTYNQARVELGMPPAQSFSEITSDPEAISALASVYMSIDDVDLWVGGITERHLIGTSLGETFSEIWGDQFTRLRDGDRYFYLNQSWDSDLLSELETTRLSDIIVRNTEITSLPDNVFLIGMQDYGDAPFGITSPFYPTMLSHDGPRHAVGPLFLGQSVDQEADGQPTEAADGDGADEDGVVRLADLVAVTDASTISSFAVEASRAGKLDAWIDFNHDGDFEDASEHVFASIDVAAGVNLMEFAVPARAKDGLTAARFRLSQLGGLASTGPASDGEVEDYMLDILDADEYPDASVNVVDGTVELSMDSSWIVADTASIHQFKAPLATLGSLSIVGSDQDDAIVIGCNANHLAEHLANAGSFQMMGGSGVNSLAMVGEANAIDLSDPSLVVSDFDMLDLSAEQPTTLSLDAAAVQTLSGASGPNVVTILAAEGDVIDVKDAVDWRMVDPIIREGEFLLVTDHDAASVEIEADVPHPWQNFLQVGDVNNDGSVSAGDALRIINELGIREFSAQKTGELMDPLDVPVWRNVFFDHNGDDHATSLDALRVINELARENVQAEEELTAKISESTPKPVLIAPSQQRARAETSVPTKIEPLAPQRTLPGDTAFSGGRAKTQAIDLDLSDAANETEKAEAVDQLLADATFVTLL